MQYQNVDRELGSCNQVTNGYKGYIDSEVRRWMRWGKRGRNELRDIKSIFATYIKKGLVSLENQVLNTRGSQQSHEVPYQCDQTSKPKKSR